MIPRAQNVGHLLFGEIDVVARAYLKRDRKMLHAVGP
jgi:hypothetical protein